MRNLLLSLSLAGSLLLGGCAFVDEYFLPAPQDTVQEIKCFEGLGFLYGTAGHIDFIYRKDHVYIYCPHKRFG